ncbi:MAG TPA: ATP-dependent Clp protease adaptor ClpS [Clostridia bacterium]|nr:ATP-dependent Clp protease adaptor ClpS [Clostridia bacterium]
MSRMTESNEGIKVDVRRPKLYRIILLNDDYTTMEFVIEILMGIFHKSATEATKIMLDVHEKGKGIVGIYTYDIALTKVIQVEEASRANEFPLKAIMEEE